MSWNRVTISGLWYQEYAPKYRIFGLLPLYVVKLLTSALLPSGGGYTNTDPESRRITVSNTKGRVLIKVVYVVLEAQYQSSISAGVNPDRFILTPMPCPLKV